MRKAIAEGAQGIGGGVSPTTSQAVWNTIETYQSMIEDNNRSIEKMQEKIRQLQTAETQTNYLFLDADMIFKHFEFGISDVGYRKSFRCGEKPARRGTLLSGLHEKLR